MEILSEAKVFLSSGLVEVVELDVGTFGDGDVPLIDSMTLISEFLS